MNDDIFEYLIEMGAMRPEEVQMQRKQAMIDELRRRFMQGPEGQMVGKHYVAPSLTQYAAQLGGAVGAGMMQKDADAANKDMMARQRQRLEELRRRRQGGTGTPSTMTPEPVGMYDEYGNANY